MRGLLVRLSAIDSDAERAVRIISFFDGLTRNHANHEMLVRAAAGLAECAVGVTGPDGQVLAYLDPHGSPVDETTTDDQRNSRSLGTTGSGGHVWLDRVKGSEIDEMVLDRLAVTAEIILEQRRSGGGSGSDEGSLVRTLVNIRVRDLDRLNAARSLHMVGPAVIVAASTEKGRPESLRETRRQVGGTLGVGVRAAIMQDEVACLIVLSADVDEVASALITRQASSSRAGCRDLRSAIDAPAAWAGALRALRFATARREPVVQERHLGAVALLADVPGELLLQVPDVGAVADVAKGRSGVQTLEAVDAICREGTLRKASVLLDLHHSSVSSRLHLAEEGLGFSLSTQEGLLRARLALEAWRLAAVPVV